MRTTVDLPDPLYRRAKAAAGNRGIKLREIFAEALERHLNNESNSAAAESDPAGQTPPKVTASDLAKFPDAGALRRAFPNGYRIVGPLIAPDEGAPPIRADRVAEETARMDQEELENHGRPR